MANSRNASEPASSTDSAPELGAFHDEWFIEAEKQGREIYGSADDWSPVQSSGHYRRMDVLKSLDLGSIKNKVAVDFGTGPWGFGCIFPKLREARRCIGFDVSAKALEMAAERDGDIKAKTIYKTSDGDTIPLEDNTVDVFWGGEVIEHVRNPRLFLQEIARVCVDGARVILSTPNRDALYYRARGEQYAIGPEHINLMSYTEIEKLLALFMDRYNIMGYETSLSPELDRLQFTAESLAAIQERAAIYPQAASGFIVDGFVHKASYKRNKRTFQRDEFLWNSDRVEGAAEAEPLALFGPIKGGSIAHNAPFRFSTAGHTVTLLFWAHPWSGEANITVGRASRVVSLYSAYSGFRRVDFSFPGRGPHAFEVRRTGRKAEAAQHDEVILYKVISYTAT